MSINLYPYNTENLSRLRRETIIVNTPKGAIKGLSVYNDMTNKRPLITFKRIPYGKHPCGPLRFRDPIEVEPWEGIRDCSSFEHYFPVDGEDILYVTVNTIAIANYEKTRNHDYPKPVMVFVPGEWQISYRHTISNYYGGEYLCAEDVVLVVVSYRKGTLGFTQSKDPSLGVPGNAGLKDIRMALQWVQKNIALFTGDPNNVTLFGQGFGATCVHYLMMNQTARQYFHRVILQSGTALHPWALSCEYDAKNVALSAGLPQEDREDDTKILNYLQSLSVFKLWEVENTLGRPYAVKTAYLFGPRIETPGCEGNDPIIERPAWETMRENFETTCPVMLGFNGCEGMFAKYLNPHITDHKTAYDVYVPIRRGPEKFKPPTKEQEETIIKKYRWFYYQNREHPLDKCFFKFIGDTYFIRSVWATAKILTRTSKKHNVYFYKFNLVTQLNPIKHLFSRGGNGACHGDELGYLFKTPNHFKVTQRNNLQTCIVRMVKLWTNFAKTGNPNYGRAVLYPPLKDLMPMWWLPTTRENPTYLLELDAYWIRMSNPKEQLRMAFWDNIYHDIWWGELQKPSYPYQLREEDEGAQGLEIEQRQQEEPEDHEMAE